MFASKEGAWSGKLEDLFGYFFPVKLATSIFFLLLRRRTSTNICLKRLYLRKRIIWITFCVCFSLENYHCLYLFWRPLDYEKLGHMLKDTYTKDLCVTFTTQIWNTCLWVCVKAFR